MWFFSGSPSSFSFPRHAPTPPRKKNTANSFVDKDWRDTVTLGMASMGPVQAQIVFSGVCFFGATFGAIVLTLIGTFFLACGKYTNCTGTKFDEMDDVFGAWLVFAGWWLMGLVVIIMFLLSGVLVPLSMLLSDTCAVVADFPTDMHAYLDGRGEYRWI